MTDIDISNEYGTLFTAEQGKYYYYSCGLLVVSIGYCFNLILTSTKPNLFLPMSSLGLMIISLGCGLHFLQIRINNFYYRQNAFINGN